jgi:predicted nucleotidyltransferase
MSFFRIDAPADPTQHPAMLRFAASVRALYGDRVQRIVLFGSRARGEAREDSDWDVAVFLRDLRGYRHNCLRLSDTALEILCDSDNEINFIVMGLESYHDTTAFMREVRRAGIDLAAPIGVSGVDARVKPGHDDVPTISIPSSSPGLTRRSRHRPPAGISGQRETSPEVADLLGQTKRSLNRAREILAKTDLHAVVAREAYAAVLRATRAIVLDRTDRVVTKDVRLRTEIGRLASDDPLVGREFAMFLADWFDVAVLADYVTDRRGDVTRETAERALATATRLVAHAEWLLSQPEPPPAA